MAEDVKEELDKIRTDIASIETDLEDLKNTVEYLVKRPVGSGGE